MTIRHFIAAVALALALAPPPLAAQTLAMPFKAEDLTAGVRISTGKHAAGIQGRGYDFGAMRLRGNGTWTGVRANGSSDTNEGHLIYNLPFYAMEAGEVIGCWRNAPENPRPGNANQHPERATGRIIGGGNHLWIRHDDGQIALYAHAVPGTIPRRLCPNDDIFVDISVQPTHSGHPDVDSRVYVPAGVDPATSATRPRVARGEFLGRVGNSGSSSGPHLHVHVESGAPGSQAVEIRFERGLWSPRNGNTADIDDWRRIDGRVLPERGILLWPPRTLGEEYARHRFGASALNRMIAHLSDSGFMPESVSCYGVANRLFFNMVWRPADTRWSLVAGVPEADYQRAFDTRGSLAPVYVDSCTHNGNPRYTVIMAARPGPFVARHGMGRSAHRALNDDMIERGFAPVTVSVISLGSTREFTTLYRKSDTGRWRLRSRLIRGGGQDQFQDFAKDAEEDGLALRYVDSYMHDGRQHFVGIATRRPTGDWLARHNRNHAQFQTVWEDATESGLRTRAISGMNGANSHIFAGVWNRP